MHKLCVDLVHAKKRKTNIRKDQLLLMFVIDICALFVDNFSTSSYVPNVTIVLRNCLLHQHGLPQQHEAEYVMHLSVTGPATTTRRGLALSWEYKRKVSFQTTQQSIAQIRNQNRSRQLCQPTLISNELHLRYSWDIRAKGLFQEHNSAICSVYASN